MVSPFSGRTGTRQGTTTERGAIDPDRFNESTQNDVGHYSRTGHETEIRDLETWVPIRPVETFLILLFRPLRPCFPSFGFALEMYHERISYHNPNLTVRNLSNSSLSW